MNNFRGVSLRRWYLSRDLKEVREAAMWVSGGREPLAEETANAKDLRLNCVCLVFLRNSEGPMLLDQREE